MAASQVQRFYKQGLKVFNAAMNEPNHNKKNAQMN